MKKLLTILVLGIASFCSCFGQSNYRTVQGYVLDKNGSPIAGAEVMSPTGGESAITDADGSFTISVHPYLKSLTASYVGMGSQTLKTSFSGDMIFILDPSKKRDIFVNVMGGYQTFWDVSGGTPTVGLMGGVLGKWGAYAKVALGVSEINFAGTVGAIKSIYKQNAFVYLGVGAGTYTTYHMISNDGDIERYNEWMIAIDAGLLFKVSNHFNINVGYTFTQNNAFMVGVGYVF